MANTLDTFDEILTLTIGDLLHVKRGTGINSDLRIKYENVYAAIKASLEADPGDFITQSTTDVGSAAWVLDEDDMVSDSAIDVPTQQSVKAFVAAQIAAALVGGLDYKGGYNAATNTPDLDTAPSGILKGDMYTVTDAGTFFTEPLAVGDALFSNQDSPTLLSHWTIVQGNLEGAIVDADFSAAEGLMRKSSAGVYTTIKTNLNAAVDPTINEDSNDGYGLYSPWLNTTLDKLFFCLDATVGAAVWQEVGAGGGGGLTASVKIANYTITGNEDVGVDSIGGTFDITLKATPNEGDVAFVHDVAYNCSVTPVPILRNGSTINGLAEDASLNINGGGFWFIYSGTTWEFTPLTSGGLDQAQVDARVVAVASGKQRLWISAKEMNIHSNASEGTINTSIASVNLGPSGFEQSSFAIRLPKRYDNGQIRWRIFWAPNSTNTGNCLMYVFLNFLASGDLVATGGTAFNLFTQAGNGTTDDLHITAWSSNQTITGTPTDDKLLVGRVQRQGDDAADTFTGEAQVIGVEIEFTTNTPTDA
jgi:hypothetical protein